MDENEKRRCGRRWRIEDGIEMDFPGKVQPRCRAKWAKWARSHGPHHGCPLEPLKVSSRPLIKIPRVQHTYPRYLTLMQRLRGPHLLYFTIIGGAGNS